MGQRAHSTWERISEPQDALDARLVAESAGRRSERNFAGTQRCAPATDLRFGDLDPESDPELVAQGATLYVYAIADADTSPDRLLAAGTPLRLVGGTNTVCDMGWEQPIYGVMAGPLVGSRVAPSGDLRIGLSPALARVCLRDEDTGRTPTTSTATAPGGVHHSTGLGRRRRSAHGDQLRRAVSDGRALDIRSAQCLG